MGRALHTPGAPGVGAVSPAEARLDDAGLLTPQGPGLITPRTGVLHGPGATTIVTGSTDAGPMTVNVNAHHWVTSRGPATDGVYRGANEIARKVSIAAAPASGTRIDVVYVKQNDQYSTLTPDGNSDVVYAAVTGTVGAGKPPIPVGAEELATVTVTPGATTTLSAGITIANTARLLVARGAPIPVRTLAERDALPKWDGLAVKRLDVPGRPVEECDGTTFRRYTLDDDTGWQTVPVNSPFTPWAGEEPQVRRINKQVRMRGMIGNTGVAANSNYTGVMTIPAGFRPPTGRPVVIALGTATGTPTAAGHIRDTGDVYLRTSATVSGYYAYDTSWWLD